MAVWLVVESQGRVLYITIITCSHHRRLDYLRSRDHGASLCFFVATRSHHPRAQKLSIFYKLVHFFLRMHGHFFSWKGWRRMGRMLVGGRWSGSHTIGWVALGCCECRRHGERRPNACRVSLGTPSSGWWARERMTSHTVDLTFTYFIDLTLNSPPFLHFLHHSFEVHTASLPPNQTTIR